MASRDKSPMANEKHQTSIGPDPDPDPIATFLPTEAEANDKTAKVRTGKTKREEREKTEDKNPFVGYDNNQGY